MKVKITHTVELNVPKNKYLIRPVRQQLEKSLQHFSSLEFLLSDADTSQYLSRMHLTAEEFGISGHHAARGTQYDFWR